MPAIIDMKTSIALLFLLLPVSYACSQAARDSELYVSLQKHDSLFFEKCFNQCDLDYLEKAVHRELTFYHDQGGIQDRAQFFENVRWNICSDPANKPIRKVAVESLEVYPLFSNGVLYGAIQSGVHRFYRRREGKADELTATARFTHVYLLENGNWILREVLSFDHKSP